MEWGDQGALIQMMGRVQCRGRMVSCCRMHRELILSHGVKRRHPYVEMDGLAFRLTSQFGPVDFGLCVGCQTVLQKPRQQHVLNGLTQIRKRTYQLVVVNFIFPFGCNCGPRVHVLFLWFVSGFSHRAILMSAHFRWGTLQSTARGEKMSSSMNESMCILVHMQSFTLLHVCSK